LTKSLGNFLSSNILRIGHDRTPCKVGLWSELLSC
jgi:hypothetical protein